MSIASQYYKELFEVACPALPACFVMLQADESQLASDIQSVWLVVTYKTIGTAHNLKDSFSCCAKACKTSFLGPFPPI